MNDNEIDDLTYEDFRTNRDKVLKPNSKHSYWCYCDKYKVTPGKKCKICGTREKYKLKKEKI